MSQTDVTIRKASLPDAPGIARVHVDSWHTTYAGIIPADQIAQRTLEKRAAFWHQTLSRGGSPEVAYVAEATSGEIIGFASGGPQRGGDAMYQAEVYAIYLLQAHQGSGTGRRLLAALSGELLGLGYRSMLVWVLAANPFCAFYEALGGKQVRRREIPFGEVQLAELAYGWDDIRPLAGAHAIGE